MLGSEDETSVVSSVIQSLDGHSSDALTNVCGKQVADIISTDQKRNKKVLEGHSLEEFSVECNQPDSCDCLLTSLKGQHGEKYGDLCPQLEKIFLYCKKGDLSHAQQVFDQLCSFVINDNFCCLPLNEVSKEVDVCISKLNSVGLTKLMIFDGLVLLSSNNFELHNTMDILNILGILALELRLPHKANKIFQLRVEQLQNDEKCVELLDKMIIWNNFVVSCAVSGSNIARHLDAVRKLTSSVKESCPDASDMCAVVLNNLGRVKLDMGKNDEAELYLVEGLDMLDQNRWLNTPQQRMWEVVMRLNISKLYSAKRKWKLAQEQLEFVHNFVLVLDTGNKPYILAFVLAEKSELYFEMKQYKESVEKIDRILPWFSQIKFWSIESIFGEMQVLILMKIVNMLQLSGRTVKAREILKQVSEVFQPIYGSEHFSRAEILYELGRLSCLLGKYKESTSLLSEAVKIYEHFVGSSNSKLVSLYCELAHVQHFYLEEKSKARENVEKAFCVLDQSRREEKDLQLSYLTKLMKAGILDSLSSYNCDGKSLDLTFLHTKLFSHQAVDCGLMLPQTEVSSEVHLTCNPMNSEDLLTFVCKFILQCIPLKKTSRDLKDIKNLLRRLAKKEGSLELQMLLHGCFGFVKASTDETWARCNGKTWLNKALQTTQKLLTLRRDEPPNNILLSSLALVAQTCNLMENKEKELTLIFERMKDLLSLVENEDVSDVYTYFLDRQMIYISAQKILFQDKIVTVNVMVTEEFSKSNASNRYPHSNVSVHPLKTDACPPRIFVLAKCCHKVDIESLRLLSRTVSESLRGSLQVGGLLTTDLVVSVKSLVSVKSCKALCQEMELTLPLFLKEKSMVGGSDHCGLNSFSDDAHLKHQLCSSYLTFSCSGDCTPRTLFRKFLVLCISRSDQLGVLSDVSFTANTILLFLKDPKVSINLRFLNSAVELRTKTLYPSDMMESKPCPCSRFDRTVNHILMESCASIGAELCSQVENRCCSRLGNDLIKQPSGFTAVPEKQLLPWKDETCERKLCQDIKFEIQILRWCLKRSTTNVAVLQAVIEGLVNKKLRTFPGKVNFFGNDPSCSNTEDSESSGYPLLSKGDERTMVSHELLHADSGIDSSDSERKGAAKDVVNCKYEHKQTQADMPGTCADGLPFSLSTACTGPIADSCISVSDSPDLDTQKTVFSDNLATTSQTFFSSESDDSSSEEGSFSIKKENVRKASYRIAEKQSVKRLCKSGKQRDIAYLQKTIHRLERKLKQKTEELNDLQRSYGEVLFERDAALRSFERIKFDIELKQRQKRLGECINGAEKLEESRDAPISGGERGDDDSSSLGSHAGGFKTREEGDYSLCVSAKALLRPEVRAKDEVASFASTAEECNQTNVTDVTDGTVVSEDVQEPHTGDLPSKAKSRLFNLEFESCSVAKNSSLIVVDTGFSNSLSDVDSIRPLLYGQRLNTAGSSEDQDSCEEYFSATEGNERSYHKSYATERPSNTLTEISFKEADRSLRSNNLQKKDSGLLIVDNESPALSFCKQGSEVDCSEKLELSYTRNVKPISSWSHFVNLSQQLNGEATSLPSGVSVTASGTIYTNNPEDVKSYITQECRTVEMKTVEDPLSLNQRAIDEAKRRFKFDFRSCDRLPKKAEGTPSGNSKYCFEICDELPPVKHDQLELKSSSSSHDDDLGVIVTQGRSSSDDDDDDDEDVCDGVIVTHLRNPNRINNKATVTERVTNVFPADEKSRLIYIRQDSRSKKDNLLLSNTTVDNENDYLESQLSFTVQSSSPKDVEQRVREPSNLSSAENTGLESAFLARHSRDISLSIHSNPKSNDVSLSTECNFAETEAKLQQQQVESEVEREEIWKKKQKQSETTQLQQWKTRALNGHQSGDDFQYTLNLKQSTESWKDTASSKIMPCPSNTDIDISPRDCTGDLLGNSFTTKNSNFSKDHVQGERFSNTDGEQDTDSNDVGNNKALCPSEKKSNNFEEKLQPKHETQGSEEANGAFSQSQGESSSTLQAQVAEACALIESVYRERKAIAMEAKNRQKKLKEEWKQVQKEKEERNYKGKEITVDKGDSDGGELEDSNEKYPVQESPEWLCEHYRRRCKVKFSCCNVFHACHRCHNNDDSCPNEEAKAQNATHVQCLMCMAEQPVTESYDTQTCQSCGTKLSEYFCPKCKHFTGSEKKPYHCDKCGICRIHEDRSFHCDVCNVCLDKRLQGKHKCRPDSGHDECCICLEDAFNGCQILPCSHKVHRDCAIAMFQNGVRTCPVCRYPLYNEGED